MYRVVYRNWPDHESLTLNHTVDVDGTDHAGVRWYELRRAAGPWAIAQAGTHAPDAAHRWMASAAMDGSGDFAIGYSVSSPTSSPTIRYAGRASGDPAGILSHTETTLVPGTGAQLALSRWGDYSMLSVDPVDDCTFWYTQEYYAAFTGSGWATRVGSFRFPECVSCVLVGSPVLTLQVTGSGLALNWTAAQNATNYDVVTGSLSTLRATSGNFTTATTACAANDVPGMTAISVEVDPAPDDGRYYLVRATGIGCRGTYDDGSASQQGGRDAGIAAAAACP